MRWLAIICSLWLSTEAWAELKSAEMKSSIKPSSKIGETLHPEPRASSPSTPPTQKLPPLPPPKPIIPVAKQASYLNPGALVERKGKWEGGDHLFNLPSHIGVYVTVVKGNIPKLPFSEEQIKKEVEALFQEASIQPTTLVMPGKPPLPAFQIEILLYPIEKGFAVSCTARLLESVTLDRFKPSPHTAFQAITWERQSLIIGPVSQFDQLLLKYIREMTKAFTEEFQGPIGPE